MTDQQDTPHEWQEPSPLEAAVIPPPFPTEALPEWLANHIHAEAAASQVPEDLAGMLALAALSTAVQGRINAIANNGNWEEPVTLYTATILPPGHRKSAIFERINRPILNWEEQIQEIERPAISQAQQEYKELEQTVEKADTHVQKCIAKWNTARSADPSNPHVADAELRDLQMAREYAATARTAYAAAKPTVETRLVYNDLTPEKASTALSQQRGEHIAVISDEGGVFDVLSGGRYSDRLNLDVFLKGHSGNIILVDRIGRPSERITRPMVTLGLAIQPQVIQEIGKSRQMHGRGLLARFLYSAPDDTLGDRLIDAPSPDPAIRATYEANIAAICTAAHAQERLHTVPLSDEAHGVFHALQQQIEPMLREDVGELSDIVEWAAKLAGAILRLAALIAAARALGMPSRIEYIDMISAIEFNEYLIAHARRAFAMMGITSGSKWQGKILKRIRVDGLTTFTSRELERLMHSDREMSSDEFEEVLRDLANKNYLKQNNEVARPGKLRTRWTVNPLIHATAADYGEPT